MLIGIKPMFNLLLVEDDLGDAGLVKIAMRRSGRPIELHHVKDGAEALAFLRRIGGEFQTAPRPDLILLDLNLPGRSGHEILDDIRADDGLRTIPVVVFSTSEAQRDVNMAYDRGATSFITKPMDVDVFVSTLHVLEEYWLNVVTLPR